MQNLPDEILDADIAILGRKGTGKSFTAKGLVERLLNLKRRVLVLDPLSHWYGLRTSASGERPGYPVAIFGGVHGDIPLDPAAAVPMADILARENVPAVIDIADLSKTAQQAFLLKFLHQLRRMNTEALTIVLEEADVFAPQNPLNDDSKALHAEIDWIVRRGRFKGFRVIAVTQRPARLSKDVLTQCSTLIAHKMPAPQDRAAVKDWIDANGDRELGRQVLDSLPQLPVGVGWVWAIDEGFLERVEFPRIRTLDTSATPKAGEARIEPKTLAEVDLSAIRKALEKAPAATAGKPSVSPKMLLQAQEEAIRKQAFAEGLAEGRRQFAEELMGRIGKVEGAVEDWKGLLRDAMRREPQLAKNGSEPAKSVENKPIPAPKPQNVNLSDGELQRRRTIVTAENSGRCATGPQMKILNALAWLARLGMSSVSRSQVAWLAGYSAGSGNFGNLLSQCRTLGWIEYPSDSHVMLTPSGYSIASHPPEPPTSQDLQRMVRDKLTGPQWSLLEKLIVSYPNPLSRENLGQFTGYSHTSGNFGNLLSQLKTAGFIEYPTKGEVRAASLLFL
jgi:hypothetical protein